MIVFSVVFCISKIVFFLLVIVLPVLWDLQALLALFLKQKRKCNFTWLDPIQCKKTCTIFNGVQFSLKNVYAILRH